MGRKVFVLVTILTFVVFFATSITYAKMSYSVGAGFSKPLGEGSEYWKVGFTIGGNGFYHLTPNILIGARVAYSRWSPDAEELTKDYTGYGIDFDISGEATVVEIVPTVSILASSSKDQGLNFFGQVGMGYYLLNLDATVRGTYMGFTVEDSVKAEENKFGLSIGGGVLIGKAGSMRIEILPQYHIIFTEEESTKYFSICVGVLFGK